MKDKHKKCFFLLVGPLREEGGGVNPMYHYSYLNLTKKSVFSIHFRPFPSDKKKIVKKHGFEPLNSRGGGGMNPDFSGSTIKTRLFHVCLPREP